MSDMSEYDWKSVDDALPPEGEFVYIHQLWGYGVRRAGQWAAVDDCGNKYVLSWKPAFWRRIYIPNEPVGVRP